MEFGLTFINTELFSQACQGELKRGELCGFPKRSACLLGSSEELLWP